MITVRIRVKVRILIVHSMGRGHSPCMDVQKDITHADILWSAYKADTSGSTSAHARIN